MVHGDDFAAVGAEEDLVDVEKALADKYKIKTERLGGSATDSKEIRVLNKILRYTPNGLELDADPRHAEMIIRDLNLAVAKPSKVPGSKADMAKFNNTTADTVTAGEAVAVHRQAGKVVEMRLGSMEGSDEHIKMMADSVLMSIDNEVAQEGEDTELGRTEARLYRGVAARLNYIAPDRTDLQFSTKESARHMQTPRLSSMRLIRRIGRYLLGKPRPIMKFEWQALPSGITAYSDSDWAGCPKSAKSTSGGIICFGTHMLKSWSRQQKTISLSSAEAELHAAVAACSETLGMISLMKDLGIEAQGEINVDSSAALGIVQRAGCGRVRHLHLQALWVQECRSTGRLSYRKVLGTANPSDVLTKYMPAELLDTHMRTLGVEHRGGRAKSAPTLSSLVLCAVSLSNRHGGEDDQCAHPT